MSVVRFDQIARECRETFKSSFEGKPIVGLEHIEPYDMLLKNYDVDVETTFTKSFKKGQILFGRRRAYQHKACVATIDGICSGDITVIEPIEDKVYPDLLPFIIQNDDFFEHAIKGSNGALSPRVKWEHMANFEFDLPSLAEQKVLAEKLWAAYEVKQSYLKMIAATEEMVKAQFIEMFGDHENGDDWLKITVEDAIKKGYIARPLDGNHGEKHPKGDDYVSEGVPFIMAQDLKEKKVDFANCHFITEAQSKTLTKGWAKTGDVLLTHKGTIGRVAIVQPSQYESLLLTPQITYYRCLCKINNEYLAAYFATDYFMKQLKGMITGSTRASVTITQQEKLLLIIPPMDMQIRFVDIVNQADKSVCELRKSIDAIDKVIKSLINENL